MSSEGDISVAEALQQLKKRARNEENQSRHLSRAAAIPWPEPPLPKIRKEENSGPGMPPRMQAGRQPNPVPAGPKASALTGGPLGLKPLSTPASVGLQIPVDSQFGNFGPSAPPTGPLFALAGAVTAPAPVAPAPQTKVSFEIEQSKAELVLGKNASTISAIKLISKASGIHVEQHTPAQEQARIRIVGSVTEVEKAKATIMALVNGIMTTAMIFQIAGLPAPVDAAPAPAPSLLGAPGAPLGGTAPAPLPSLPGLAASVAALPKPALPSLAGLSGLSLPGAGTAGLSIPGLSMPTATLPNPSAPLPQDTVIQDKLNDYYTQWWSQYAIGGATSGGGGEQQQGAPGGGMPAATSSADTGRSQPFDKEALLRLAQQAAKEEDEPPKPAPAPAPQAPAPVPVSNPDALPPAEAIPPLVGDLTERAVAEARQLLATMPRAPADGAAAGIPGAVPSTDVGAGQQMPLSGMLNGGFQIKPQGSQAPRAQKDNDSVMKMLQTMQGNVSQSREDLESKKAQIAVQAAGRPRGPAEALPGFEVATAVQEPVKPDPQVEATVQRLSNCRPEMLELVQREMLQILQSFKPEQIVEVMIKMETTPGFSKGEICNEVGKVLGPRLREFSGTQFTSFMATFMSWVSTEGTGATAEKSMSFLAAASSEMSSRLMEFAPHEINCCLATLISASFSEMRFFAQVGRAALARYSSFGPIQLTVLLSLLSETRLTHLDLFNVGAQFICSKAKELRKADLLRLARAFGKCNIRCDPLCQAVANEVMSRLKKGDKVDPTLFKTEDLIELTWICCCLQSYHEELFRTALSQLEQMPQVSTDCLCQVYEIHLVLDSEHKEAYSRYRIDADALQKLAELYKENRRDARRCSARTRSDVSNVLKSLVEGSVSANHRTSTGLLVDVAALRKKTSTDGFIHVEIDSGMSVIRAVDQEEGAPASMLIEGPVALRRRILEKHGLIIVTLRESDWQRLDDTRDKRRHLRAQLSALNDVLE